MIHFLNLLNKQNIKYVSWKNNHEISDSLNGKSDLDIFVDHLNKNKFEELAVQEGWLEVKNPIACYPSVKHFYKISKRGKFFHLHVYFEVITGESWLKEYNLPIMEFLINNRFWDVNYKIWVLDKKAQAYVFFIRHFLKTGSIISRYLYLKEKKSYKSEWLLCDTSVNELYEYGPIVIDTYIERSGLNGKFKMPNVLYSIRFRLEMLTYLRIPLIFLPFLRIKNLLMRIKNKFFLKEKKKFIKKGIIVAISGSDGSGKSSMISELNKSFSLFQTCFVYSLGKPQSALIDFLKNMISPKARTVKTIKNIENPNEQTKLKKALALVILGFLRLNKAKKAKNMAAKGNLIFVDRWPTNNFGKMDSPKIFTNINSSKILIFLANIEKYTYKMIPKADICYYLKVSAKTAVLRNQERKKIGKENNNEIIKRHIENEEIIPICQKNITFLNEGPFDEKFIELQNNIWSEIIKLKMDKLYVQN